MKRSYLIAAAVALVVVALVAGGVLIARGRTVEVRTGEKIVCTYGHDVADNTKTIRLPASKASEYGVRTKKIVCAKHRKAEQLYQEAQDALQDGDVKTAKKRLEEVVALDSAFRQSSRQLKEIAAGDVPRPDSPSQPSGGGGTTPEKPKTPGDTAKPTGPVASLTSWMPDSVAGYRSDKPVADALNVSREYVPDGGGVGDVLVIAAEQYANAERAKDALRQQVRLPYFTGGKDVKVNGRTGWIGTDGSRYATLGIVDGSALIVFQTSSTKIELSKLTAELLKIAEPLPR